LLSILSREAQQELIGLIDQRVAEQLLRAVPSTNESPWLTVDEAATYLRTSCGAIYKRIKRGQLVAYRPEGSQILLRRDELEQAAGPARQEVLR